MSDSFKLPKGWAETTFGSVVSAVSVNDKKLPRGEYLECGLFPVVDQGQQYIGGYSNDESKVIPEDLPLLVFGDHTRAFKYLNQPFVPGADGIKVLKPIGVNAKWLYHIAHALEFPNKGYARHYQHLKSAQIIIPPIAEQRRIVAEIEKQFTRLDAGVEGLKRVQANLKRYRASVLKAACDGKLVPTEAELGNDFETGEQLLKRILIERRNAHEEQQATAPRKKKYNEPATPDTNNLLNLPAGWSWVALGQLAWSVKDGPHYSPKYTSDGVPFISGGNIRPSGVDFETAKMISPELHAELSKRCKPEVGDILYTKGGTTGIARVNTYTEEFNVWVHVAVLKLVDSVHRFYIQHTLNSPLCYAQSQKFTHGVGNQDLGLTRMIHIVLPLPPLAEQKRIVEEVERRLSVIDEMEATVASNLKRATRLRQSILQKAHDGELVPQDPNDESAEELLKRIFKQPVKPPAQRKPSRKKETKSMHSITVKSLGQLIKCLNGLGGSASPENLLLASGLKDDVEAFFDILREGRNTGSLLVPTGESGIIRMANNAN